MGSLARFCDVCLRRILGDMVTRRSTHSGQHYLSYLRIRLAIRLKIFLILTSYRFSFTCDSKRSGEIPRDGDGSLD